jgi:hypothetical protein
VKQAASAVKTRFPNARLEAVGTLLDVKLHPVRHDYQRIQKGAPYEWHSAH